MHKGQVIPQRMNFQFNITTILNLYDVEELYQKMTHYNTKIKTPTDV